MARQMPRSRRRNLLLPDGLDDPLGGGVRIEAVLLDLTQHVVEVAPAEHALGPPLEEPDHDAAELVRHPAAAAQGQLTGLLEPGPVLADRVPHVLDPLAAG